jgi:thiol-disulfide isomerase/thioredoxin
MSLFLLLTLAIPDTGPPAKSVAAIRKDVDDAEKAFRDAWAKETDTNKPGPAVEKLYKAFEEKQKAGFAAALAVAEAEPKSAEGFEALDWLVRVPRARYVVDGKRIFALATEHHAANPKIGGAIALLAYYPPHESEKDHKEAVALMKAVLDKNTDKDVRGNAALGLAWQANRAFVNANYKGKPDAEKLAVEAEKAFEAVIMDYGTCRNLRTRGAATATATLADEAKRELFELRNLRVGKVAPEVEGEDLAGQKFKLGDYRGKVVLLVFWASWCGPCMAAVPHERELVTKFKGRPFALIGVNGDEDKDKANKTVTKHEINWRSFWNGKEGPGGPISRDWNVRGWPTVYVIDAKGVIRHKYLHGKRLDGPLEELVAEAEKAK